MANSDFRTLIDPATLAAHLDDAGWVIVDCRFDLTDTSKGEQQYELGHIPRARYAHLDRDLSGPEDWDERKTPVTRARDASAALWRAWNHDRLASDRLRR